jgi:predicted  nucleic acid-binding Zn-ribbon protein
MSYLRGPMTRDQVRELMAPLKDASATAGAEAAPAATATATPAVTAAAAVPAAATSTVPPVLPSDMPVLFLPTQRTAHQAVADLESQIGTSIEVDERGLVYMPQVLATGSANFVDSRRGVREAQTYSVLIEPPTSTTLVSWDQGQSVDTEALEFLDSPEKDATFGSVPGQISTAKELSALAKDYQEYLVRTASYELFYNPVLKIYSKPGERERDFKVRAQQMAREKRDAEVDKITQKYRNEIQRFQERLAREERELAEDMAEHSSRKQDEMLSTGTSILGMLFGGRRSVSTVVSSASRRRRATEKALADIQESEEEIDALNQKIAEVQQELERISEETSARWAAAVDQVEPYEIKPSKSHVSIYRTALAWTPHWRIIGQTADGRPVDDVVPAS